MNLYLNSNLFKIIEKNSFTEEEEIYLKGISDQIQVITKDLKTLEKAVYQKSDISSGVNLNNIKSDGLNEDILTKHLLKLNEIEDQFRKSRIHFGHNQLFNDSSRGYIVYWCI